MIVDVFLIEYQGWWFRRTDNFRQWDFCMEKKLINHVFFFIKIPLLMICAYGVNIFLLYFFIFFIRSILLKYEFNLLHFFSAGHFINTCYFPCFRGCSCVHPQWRCPWMVSPLLFNNPPPHPPLLDSLPFSS